MEMFDERGGPALERPTGGSNPAGEVDVSAGADALHESADRLERRPSHEEVSGQRRPAVRPQQAVVDAQEVPRPCVARHQARLAGSPTMDPEIAPQPAATGSAK